MNLFREKTLVSPFHPLQDRFFFVQVLRALTHGVLICGFVLYQFAQPLFLNADVWVAVYMVFFVCLSVDFFCFYFYDFLKKRGFLQDGLFVLDALLMTGGFYYLSLPVLSSALVFVYLLQIISAGFAGGYRGAFSQGILVSALFSWMIVLAPQAYGDSVLYFILNNVFFLTACGLGGLLGTQAEKALWFLNFKDQALSRLGNLNELIVQNINKGLFITNEEDMVVYGNPQGLKMLDLPADFLGPVHQVWPSLRSSLLEKRGKSFTVRPGRQIEDQQRVFEVFVTPLQEGGEHLKGQNLMLFQDFTEQEKQHDQELKRDRQLLMDHLAQGMVRGLGHCLNHIRTDFLNSLSPPSNRPGDGRGPGNPLQKNPFSSDKTLPPLKGLEYLQSQVRDFLGEDQSAPHKSQGNMEFLRVNTLVEEVLEEVRGRKNFSFVNHHILLKAEGFVKGHKEMLRKAFSHIVYNSVEAMEPKGRGQLFVDTFDESPWVVVRIRDTGPGLSAKDLPYVLEPFYTTKKGRMGLGLALAARGVKSCGGSLSFEQCGETSLGQKTNTRCVIRLPLQHQDPALENALKKAG